MFKQTSKSVSVTVTAPKGKAVQIGRTVYMDDGTGSTVTAAEVLKNPFLFVPAVVAFAKNAVRGK